MIVYRPPARFMKPYPFRRFASSAAEAVPTYMEAYIKWPAGVSLAAGVGLLVGWWDNSAIKASEARISGQILESKAQMTGQILELKAQMTVFDMKLDNMAANIADMSKAARCLQQDGNK